MDDERVIIRERFDPAELIQLEAYRSLQKASRSARRPVEWSMVMSTEERPGFQVLAVVVELVR